MKQFLLCFLLVAAVVPADSASVRHTEDVNVEGHLRAGHQQAPPGGRVDSVSVPSKKKGSALGSIILGVIMWCIAPAFLWNNERISIKHYKMRFKAERWAIHIDEPEREPLKEMDGRIVYLSGTAICDDNISDSQFPLVKSDKIKLRRIFEMFQWVERSEEEGEGDNKRTVYYWEQKWSDVPQTCPHGGEAHRNPPMPMPSTKRQPTYRASYDAVAGNGDPCAEASHDKVKLGAYYLGELVIRELLNWKPKGELTADMLQGHPAEALSGKPVERDGYWYFGDKYEEIGSVRVSFEELCPGPLSIVGVLTETKQGWTFAPIKRSDSAGTGDNCAAEICGSCCIRVKELHYGDEEDDDEFKEDLDKAPIELSHREKKAFRKSQTAANVEEYAIEDDISDLCCVGPFGPCVIQSLHYLGLEEEFLAVRESSISLDKVMKQEGQEAEQRHNLARVGGFLLLVIGSWCIISPIIKILNYSWITTLLGGGLISVVLCCFACLCSISCFCLIVSTAWIANRPFLASLGLLTAISIGVGIYFYVYEQEKKEAGKSPGVQAAFLVARQAVLHGLARL